MSNSKGWFDDPYKRHLRRYFDGEKWTDQVQTASGEVTSDPIEPISATPRSGESWWKKKLGGKVPVWAALLAVFILIGAIGNVFDDTPPPQDESEVATDATDDSTPVTVDQPVSDSLESDTSQPEVGAAIEPSEDGEAADHDPPTTETTVASATTRTATSTTVSSATEKQAGAEDSEAIFYLTTLWALPVTEEQPRSGYDRDDWPHWRDTNGSGCNSRQDLLIMYAYNNNDEGDETIDVTDCVVADGNWFSWYDATETSNSSSLDVDHIVSLAEAYDSGGANWSRSQKQEFANYLGNLILTSASTNRSKSDKDLGEWKPPYQAVWCVTAQQTVLVKSTFGLSVDQRERDAIEDMLDTCNAGGQTSWRHASASSPVPVVTSTSAVPQTTSAPQTTTATPVTTAAPSTSEVPQTTTVTETTAGIPANPGDTKNCSDFATYQEAKDWYDYYFPYYGDVANLDGSDNDGLPCESRPGGPSS